MPPVDTSMPTSANQARIAFSAAHPDGAGRVPLPCRKHARSAARKSDNHCALYRYDPVSFRNSTLEASRSSRAMPRDARQYLLNGS